MAKVTREEVRAFDRWLREAFEPTEAELILYEIGKLDEKRAEVVSRYLKNHKRIQKRRSVLLDITRKLPHREAVTKLFRILQNSRHPTEMYLLNFALDECESEREKGILSRHLYGVQDALQGCEQCMLAVEEIQKIAQWCKKQGQ